MIIPFAEWLPDAADLGNPGSILIVNAVPGLTSYKPMPSYTVLTDALVDRARGAIEARDKDLNISQYAGDATALYTLTGTVWTDVSGVPYTTAAEEMWEFVRWKNQILATNWNDNIQTIELGGVVFADLTTDFKCRHLAVVGDFVVAGNTFDVTDGNVPDRIRWTRDETSWTVNPNIGSDVRSLKGAPILRIFGGEYGVIFTDRSVYRMSYQGAPTWFRIDETLPGIGLLAADAASQIGDKIYALTQSGFVEISNGSGSIPIGAGKTDEFIKTDLDDNYLDRITSVADARSGRVFWSYPGASNTDGTPNRIIVYDTKLQRWGLIQQEVEMLWRASGVGTTLEGLDAFDTNIDTLQPSLDSSQWKGGGASLLAAFNTSHQHGFFDGASMTAIVGTREVEINPGHRTGLNAFTPLVSGGTVTAQISKRDRQSDDSVDGPTLTQSASGRFTDRRSARFHRFQLTLSDDWTDAIGVEFEAIDAKRVGRRG